MKLLSKIIYSSFLSLLCSNLFGQYVSLEGKQFKLSGNDFYPLVVNYNLGRTSSDNMGSTIFYVTPSGSYGSTGDYECNDLSTCNAELQYHFAKILTMGFNTIRIDLAVTYRSDVPVTATSRHFTVFHDENMGPGNQWLTKNHAYDLDMASNFTDVNSTNHFNEIKNILTQAQTAGLKVILVCGQGFKDTLSPYNRIMWQTYDSQAATDFATYMGKLASEINSYPALLAYDFINEPIYQDMYRDGANNSNTKETLCGYVKQWVDAVHQYDNNHLVTIGSGILDEMFYFDPGIMKLDFYSAHLYTKGNPMYPNYPVINDYGIQNGFDRYDIINYWMSQTYPMPWIIGETGFAADDNGVNPGLYPNHLDNNPIHHNPPWMFGSETQQQQFAQHSLDVTRNAGASGYAWWAFQNVFWFDLNSDMNVYQEDFFGLLHWGDKVTNTWYDKPLVSNFASYLSTTGQQVQAVTLAQPSHYFDPYDIAANCASCVTAGVQGKMIDQNGNPIKNAVVACHFHIGYDIFNNNTEQYDFFYTNSDNNGSFTALPMDYTYPPNDGLWLTKVVISAAGSERLKWDWCPGCVVIQPSPITLKKIDFNYDGVLQNQTLTASTFPTNYKGWNTLTLTNVDIQPGFAGNFTARNEVKVNSEFHAANGTEVHLYCQPQVFSNCNDFQTFLMQRQASSLSANSANDEKQIEIVFDKITDAFISIFPNPNNGIFTVQLHDNNELNKIKTVSITNSIGGLVYSSMVNNSMVELNLSHLSKGIYYAKIITGQNAEIKKIIIN